VWEEVRTAKLVAYYVGLDTAGVSYWLQLSGHLDSVHPLYMFQEQYIIDNTIMLEKG
jgi:hypothetical protein